MVEEEGGGQGEKRGEGEEGREGEESDTREGAFGDEREKEGGGKGEREEEEGHVLLNIILLHIMYYTRAMLKHSKASERMFCGVTTNFCCFCNLVRQL